MTADGVNGAGGRDGLLLEHRGTMFFPHGVKYDNSTMVTRLKSCKARWQSRRFYSNKEYYKVSYDQVMK